MVDPQVARTVLRRGRRKGATRRELLAAGVTGLVETDFQNLGYGDADSEGWRQERRRFYSNPRNVAASADRFFNEARRLRGRGLSVGELAQAVQRSAFPGRYQPRLREARGLLRRYGGENGALGVARGRPGPRTTVEDPQAGSGLLDAQGGSQGLAGLIAGMQAQQPPAPPVTPPQAPFSGLEHLAMPQGFQAPSGGAPQPKGTSLSELLAAAQGAGGQDDLPMPEAQPNYYDPKINAPRASKGLKRYGGGSIRFAAGADRAGVRTQPALKKFARKISAIYGEPLTIGTGTRHSQLTVDGNVSAHWEGLAGDIPARGHALVRLGQAALIAAGADPKWARKQRGGLYNINGHQIIFATDEGGDHWDHLHAGISRG